MDGQRVDVTLADGQFDDLLHHTTGDGGIVDTVDVLWLLVQVAVEVHADGLSIVDADRIDESALIEEVEG